MSTSRQVSTIEAKSEKDSLPESRNGRDSAALTEQARLDLAASLKKRKQAKTTSAMRINAYAVPLRERLVIVSNKGRFIEKYSYRNSGLSDMDYDQQNDTRNKSKSKRLNDMTTQVSIKSVWRECLIRKSNEIQKHVELCKTCSHLSSVMLLLSGESMEAEMYSNYSSKQKRQESFKHRRDLYDPTDIQFKERKKFQDENLVDKGENLVDKGENLVDKGFFYDAKEGEIVCFSCGLSEYVGSLEKEKQSDEIRNYLKLHLNSGLFCAYNVSNSINLLLKAYRTRPTSDNQELKDGREMQELCEALITAGFNDWQPNADNEIDCPWLARVKENSSSDIVKGVLNILQLTGSTNEHASFLNRLLSFNDDSWDTSIISLCQYGLVCTDKKKRNGKCCACDLEIYNFKQETDSWKEHIKQAQQNGTYKVKCSFFGIDQFVHHKDNTEKINANILDKINDADWYPFNNYWRCKHCKIRLFSIFSNLKNINLWKVHIAVEKSNWRGPNCPFLEKRLSKFYIDFIKYGESFLDEIIKGLKRTFSGNDQEKLSQFGFQRDLDSNQCFCFCCFKRYNLPLSTYNIWDKHEGKGLNCEFAILKMPEEQLYRLEYQEQYNMDNESNQHVDSLVQRRLDFVELFQKSSLIFGTIYLKDDCKSQRLFDANYVICNDMIQLDNLFKCVKECKEIHYSCVISVFGTFDDEKNANNMKIFFDTMIQVYKKLDQEKGIIFLTEGVNTCSMQMLGSAIIERQKSTKQLQENTSAHFSPHIKAVGIVNVSYKSLFRNKQRKRIEVFVKSCESASNDESFDDTNESVPLNPNHTDFIFTTKNYSQQTYGHRYEIHKHILSMVSENNKCRETNVSHVNENKSGSIRCCGNSAKEDSSVFIPDKIFSAVIVIAGDKDMIEVINTVLREETAHVIICNNTGGIANKLANIYREFDEERLDYSLKIFRELCNDKRSQITVIDMASPDSFTMHMFAIFFSLFKSQLITLNLLKELNANLFKEKLQTENSTDLFKINGDSDEVLKAIQSISKLEILKDCLNNKILGNIRINYDSNTNSKVEHKIYDELQWPFETLFIWAILTDRDSFAKFFLSNCKNIVVLSLIATYLYRLKRIQSPFYEANYKRQVKELKETYENIAIGVIDRAYSERGLKNEVFQTLQEKHELLSYNSCIEAAATAKSKRVFKTDAFGNMMDSMWYSDYATAAYVPQNKADDDEIFSIRWFPFYVRCNKGGIRAAPITKFAMSLTLFIAFLIYYVVVLLLLYEGRSSAVLEVIIFVWIVGLVFEESYEIAQSGSIRNYFGKSSYNIIDVLIIIIGFIAFFTGLGTYEFVKYFYWLNGVLLIFRLFREFAAFNSLGPKLTMIYIMMKQLAKFSIILITVLALFSITYSMFPSSSEEISFFKPFFLIGQMIYEFDEISQAQQACFTNNTGSAVNNSDGSCAAFVLKFITSATFIYIVNLLVLNFIIALFASVYEIYTAKSEQLWRLGFYRLIEKYTLSPILPIPFCIGEIIFYLLNYSSGKLKQNRVDESQKQAEFKTENNFDEQICFDEYLESLQSSQKNLLNAK